MNTHNMTRRLSLAVFLIMIAKVTFADGHYFEAKVLNKLIDTQVSFDVDGLSAGFDGDDGSGVALTGRWSFGKHLYVFVDYEAYRADFDVFISDESESLRTSQETGSRILSVGAGFILPISKYIDIEADVSSRSRKTEFESFSLALSSGNGAVGYDGTDLKEKGMAWRLGLVADLGQDFELFISASGNDSAKLDILSDGIQLRGDQAYEIGARYGLTDRLQVGLSWENSEEGTAALALRYNF